MALIIKDRIKEVTTTTGTGDIVLGGSSATYDSFGSCMSNGDTTYYAIVHTVGGTDEWEVGLGTYNSTTDAIARTTISASSNAGSAVNFSAGPKNIFITNPADKAVYLNADGNIDLAGTIDGRDLSVDGAKLDGIESGATADQTGAEIKTALFAESDTNNLTDTLLSKLNGIESGATADQTKADIDALGINADLLDGQHGSYYTAYADTAVANLVDSAPGTLNTLNELAAALGDDPNFATTVTNSIATKLPLAGGTMTGDITFNSTQLFDGRDVSADGATLDTLDTEAWRKGTDIPSGADLNNYTSDGYYHQNSNANAASGSNYPVANAGMLEVTSDGSMVYQRYTVYLSTHDVYVRTYYNGTWYSWSKQWSDANDGASSGLDADLLDGNHASAFALASHTHSFDSLTSKTSGTGDYQTTGKFIANSYVRAGNGSGGVSLTHNDGYGNANVTFNHEAGVPEQNGNAGRIEVNTDGTTDASMTIELKSNVTGGSAVSLINAARFSDTDQILYYAGSTKLQTNSSGVDVTGTLTATQFYAPENSSVPTTTPATKFGRDSNQYITFHGDASGNILSTVSTSGNPKNQMRFGISLDSGSSLSSIYTLNGSSGTIWHSGNDSTLLKTTGGTMSGTLNMNNNVITNVEDIALNDRIYHDGDTDTYIQFHAADQWRVVTGGGERFEITTTAINAYRQLDMNQNDIVDGNSIYMDNWYRSTGNTGWYSETYGGGIYMTDSTHVRVYNSKALRIDSTSNNSIWTKGGIRVDGSGGTRYISAGPNSTTDGSLYNNTGSGEYGAAMLSVGRIDIARWQNDCMRINRMGNDGALVYFYQAGSAEGSITVSGTTVSYNGGHLARWSRLADDTKDVSIVKGTVMTNLDEMVVWHHEAQPATYYVEGDELPEGKAVGDEKEPAREAYTEDNEQLNKMAVSSVEGDPNVAGVFVNWDEEDEYNDMNIAMTGDMVIRIAQGTTVTRGDLLMSAGDGTAKPQGDDIVRSKTIAKVTSTNVSHTYDDGSYLVPCVLMAC